MTSTILESSRGFWIDSETPCSGERSQGSASEAGSWEYVDTSHLVCLPDCSHSLSPHPPLARTCNQCRPASLQVSLLVSLFMRARRRRSVQKHDLRQMLGDRLRDTARWAAFLGSFAGVFVAFDEGIAHAFGKARCCFRHTYKTRS